MLPQIRLIEKLKHCIKLKRLLCLFFASLCNNFKYKCLKLLYNMVKRSVYMRIVINAGHTKLGVGTGASKYLNESKETRKIAYELMKLLADTTHEVIPAVYDRSSDNLKAAVDAANKNKADLFISIHLNAGGGKGCEAYTYKGVLHRQAINACKNLNKLGFTNRGVKDGSKLYVIKNTKCTAVLIEVCFVDSALDAEIYSRAGYNKIAKALYDAII